MKKILILINNMKVGGIQKSLSELLCALSEQDRYDISLFCINKEGVYIERIPENVKIIEGNNFAKISEMSSELCKKMGFKYYFLRVCFSFWSKLFSKRMPARILCALMGKIEGEYDIAISYAQPINSHSFANLTNEMLIYCCHAKRKIGFVHCDFASYGGNSKVNRRLYSRIDAVAAVSDSVGKRFEENVKEAAGKLHTVYNFSDAEEIIKLSLKEPLVYDKTSVITVARLSEEKGLLRCVPIMAKLRDEGFDFYWHIVGGGPLYNSLSSIISEYNMTDKIILHGEQTNPYRYMKNADFFLLPSFHEAAPMVFNEAIILGVTVLSTRTLSAEELVSNRNGGYVCDNDDASIYEMLKKALEGELAYCNALPRDRNESFLQFDNLCEKIREGEKI